MFTEKTLSAHFIIAFPDQPVSPASPGRRENKQEAPVPKKPEGGRDGVDRLRERMKRVDPNQSERYRQRTGQ
ncbi:MAG: ubiquitin-like protein UBact [Leptospirillum sp.]|jgi:hypothetical protein|nr:ubiquitin-like protein UBact [Nitrospiraceae bacterium]